MSPIDGYCDPDFIAVKNAFAENFSSRDEVGASCCVIKDGRKVVDLWGGYQDPSIKKPWEEDTMSLVFSCTKAATALCAQILIDQGKLDLDTKVTDYWPEFGQKGKDQVTVRMILGHQSAVPALRDSIKDGGMYDFDYMVERLAAEEPFWEPGTANGYHMITFGWTVGELVRRVSGKPLGQFFKDNIAKPLGLNFHIGLQDSDFDRTAKMIPFIPDMNMEPTPFLMKLMSDPKSIQFLALMNRGDFQFDAPDAWRAEIGGSGGITNARSLAKMYDGLLGNDTFLSKARIEDMRQPVSETQEDKTLLIPTRFAQGFMLRMDNRGFPGEGNSLLMGEQAFGHVGMGGSVGFADPETEMAFGYTMTRMGGGILLNDRGQSLVDATYGCL